MATKPWGRGCFQRTQGTGSRGPPKAAKVTRHLLRSWLWPGCRTCPCPLQIIDKYF